MSYLKYRAVEGNDEVVQIPFDVWQNRCRVNFGCGFFIRCQTSRCLQQIAAPDWSLYYFLANHSVPFSEIFVFYFLFFFSGHYVSSFCSVFPKNCIFALSKSDSRKFLMYIIKSKCYHRSNISWQQLKIQFGPYSQVR